jgi:hypothetical protein
MLRKSSLLLLLFAGAGSFSAVAQTREKLVLLIQHIYGPNGLFVDSQAVNLDGTTHIAHFNSDFQQQFKEFNTALAGQLTSLPLPSPASGFTYTLDLSTGLQQRTTQSFGPILSERAETIGKNKLSFGFNYQQFRFNSIEGVDLSNFSVTYRHEDYQLGGGRTDVITSENSLDTSISQFIAFLTCGLTNSLDVSIAVPIVRTKLSMVSNATIVRIGTTDPSIHYFLDPSVPGGFGTHQQFSSSGTASGLGDMILRVKHSAIRRETFGLALALDMRAPTGDEMNLLGSGAYGVKPSVAMSMLVNRISPHLNLGYQWNGKSLLAGDLKSQKVGLPKQFLYVAGFDVGVSNKLTLAFDFLGQRVFDSPRLGRGSFRAGNGITYPDFQSRTGSFDVNSGAIGLKTNVAKRLLVNFDLRIRLNHAGLHDKASPLVGIEYSF